MGWGSHTRTHRWLPAAALVAGVALAAAGCSGGGSDGRSAASSGATAGTAPPGTAPVDVPLAGGDQLRVAGLPAGWALLAPAAPVATATLPYATTGPSAPRPGPPPTGIMATSFMQGQPDDLAASTKALLSFTTVPATDAGRAFLAPQLALPAHTIEGRQVHGLRGPGEEPLTNRGTQYGSAVFRSGDYYVVASWSGPGVGQAMGAAIEDASTTVPSNQSPPVSATTTTRPIAHAPPPPVTIPARSSPPTTLRGAKPSSVPGAHGDLPLWGHLLVDLTPGGYKDFAVHLRKNQDIQVLSLADDGIDTEIEMFAPDGSSVGTWKGGQPKVVNGLEFSADSPLPATGTYVVRVVHTGGSDRAFLIGFFGER